MSRDSPEGLWAFSLDVYGRESVGRACLELQERHGVDVNWLLYCCWLGASGRGELEEADASRLLDLTGRWQSEVVEPLRHVRRGLKAWSGSPDVSPEAREAYRKRILDLEIEGERIEQKLLEDASPPVKREDQATAERARLAAANLVRYFSLAGVTITPADLEAVAYLLAAAFPALRPNAVEALTELIGPAGA